MEEKERNVGNIFTDFGFYLLLALVIDFMLHFTVQALTLVFLREKAELVFSARFFEQLFSLQALPNLITYLLLLLVVLWLFRRTRSIIEGLNREQLKRERDRAVLETSQRLTGTVIESLARNNNDIQYWIASKRMKGERVPRKVEEPSRRISHTLALLSEVSFLRPYNGADSDLDSFTSHIEEKLQDIERNSSNNRDHPVEESTSIPSAM